MKMPAKQKKLYDWYISLNYEYVEELPAKGVILLRKGEKVGDAIYWSYVTLYKNGNVKNGNHLK
ncbi:hypothetical protein GW796_09290 [archaeon]|nr:hypothetical protein [archaeon]NCT58922.1 hypothetical protein [archaeon]